MNTTSHKRLYPWVLAILSDGVKWRDVKRFRKRNDADEHRKILKRSLPDATLKVVYDN